MYMFALPGSVSSTALDRLIQHGEYIALQEDELIFTKQSEMSEFHRLGSDCFQGDFDVYQGQNTNDYYLAEKNAPFDRWQALANLGDISSVATHANCLIYSASVGTSYEQRTWIKDIRTGHEFVLDPELWEPVCGFFGVVLVTGQNALSAIDISSGKVLWKVPHAMPDDRKFFSKYGYFAGVTNPQAGARELYLVDMSSGKILVQTALDSQLGPFSTLLDAGNSLYVRTRKSIYILNFDVLILTSFPIEEGELCGGFFAYAGKVYLTGNPSKGQSAWLAAYDIASGQKVALYEFSEYKNCASPFRLGEYIAMDIRNDAERIGWCFKRFLVFKPSQFATLTQNVEMEPIIVELHKELDDRGESRYRVIVPPCERFETFIWQLEIGAHSCGQVHSIHLNSESKPYDEDFAGQIILDCRNRTLDDAQKNRVANMVAYVEDQLTIFNYVDAIKQKPIRISCEF